MSTFIFDPNDIKAFADRWMEEVGNLHRGVKYNGWAFFDDDRRLIDVWLPDIDGKWVDIGLNADDFENKGWGALLVQARRLGATNIIGVHAHLASEPAGPCDDLPSFIASGIGHINTATDNEIQIRAIVVLRGDEFEGVLIAKRNDAPTDQNVMMARILLPRMTQMAATDPTIARVLPIVEMLANGQRPPMDQLIEAINVLNIAIDEAPVNPMTLPNIDLTDKRYLN